MNKVATVLLLGSQAHVGKDTLGELLIQNEGFVRFGFADKLKDVVADLYGFSHEQMHGHLKNVPDERYIRDSYVQNSQQTEDIYYTPREILQDFGQEQRKRFPDIWADYVCRQIVTCNSSDKFVITDFRFPNEYDVVKRFADVYSWNVYCIKLERPDSLRGEVAGSTNISETALNDFDSWDFVIDNSTTSKDILYNDYRQYCSI